MYICLCYGVSDKKIEKVVQQGAQSVQDVQKACNAGTKCGSCICDVKEILGRMKGEQSESNTDKKLSSNDTTS